MKIGICVEALGVSFRESLPLLARLGVAGTQVDAIGNLNPDRLTETGRRELRNLLHSYNVQLTALNCPLRRGIDSAENQQPRLEYIRKVMTLAFELGPKKVIVQCPRIPTETEIERANLLREALHDLGRHADHIGTQIALEIGFDSGEVTQNYLDSLGSGMIGINYDPANMLTHGHDPIRNLAPLSNFLFHTHVRDVRAGNVSKGAQEVALGAGDINWLAYIATLSAIEYKGWLVIEREPGENRMEELKTSVTFLKKMMIPV